MKTLQFLENYEQEINKKKNKLIRMKVLTRKSLKMKSILKQKYNSLKLANVFKDRLHIEFYTYSITYLILVFSSLLLSVSTNRKSIEISMRLEPIIG